MFIYVYIQMRKNSGIFKLDTDNRELNKEEVDKNRRYLWLI